MDDYIAAAEVAERLSVSRQTAYRYMHAAGAIVIGRTVRLRRERFEAWLDCFDNASAAVAITATGTRGSERRMGGATSRRGARRRPQHSDSRMTLSELLSIRGTEIPRPDSGSASR